MWDRMIIEKRPKPIFYFLILSIVAVSACTNSISNITTANIPAIVQNPEDYINKTVVVIGTPTVRISIDYTYDFGWKIGSENKEGKWISMFTDKKDWYCSSCKVTGIIQKAEACTCQKKFPYSDSPDNYGDIYQSLVKTCLDKTVIETRCKGDSNFFVYYMHIIDVEKLS